jgi:hypothetical protein
MGLDKAPPSDTSDAKVQQVYVKACICDQLGNGALINLGISSGNAPVAVCPGPNIAYFDRLYTMREMVNHIYGRGKSLVPDNRPHMFSKDLVMSVDYFGKLAAKLEAGDAKALAYLAEFKTNLEAGLEYYRDLVEEKPFPGENLASLKETMVQQGRRLQEFWKDAQAKAGSEVAERTTAAAAKSRPGA